MIKGTIYIYDKLACILIDLGATFSFILTAFDIYNSLKLCDRIKPMIMSMPMGISTIYESIIKDVLVSMGEGMIKWDFISLPINEFNAILSMDNFSRFRKMWIIIIDK